MTSVLNYRQLAAELEGVPDLMFATPGHAPLAARLAALGPGMIDVHTHAIDPDLPAIGRTHEGRFPSVRRVSADLAQIILDGRVYREIDSRCWSVQARIRDMDAEGVAAQVLSPIPVTLCHGEPVSGAQALATAQNEFLARMVAAAPERFAALGCVPMQDTALAIAELRRCMDELGFAGVEIGTRVGDRELSEPQFVPFFEAAAESGAVVFLHPVDQTLDPRLSRLRIGFGMGMPTETATAAAGLLISGLLDQVPGVLLCLAHGGGTLPCALPRLAVGQRVVGGVTEPAKLATTQARKLWCDSLTYDVEGLRLSSERFGAGHVVLGTDYPFDAREEPAGAVLTAAAGHVEGTANIARENALALLAAAGRPRTESVRLRGARWDIFLASA
jgi:aminocarboxymuconate-semialdehyde decarboxylase